MHPNSDSRCPWAGMLLLVVALVTACGSHQTHTLAHLPGPPPAVATPAAPAAPPPPPSKDALTDPADLSGWQRAWWTSKAGYTLVGSDVKARPDAQALAQLPRRALVAKLMSEPAFAETVLKFNLYYLGFRRDSVRNGSTLAPDLLAIPQALAGARAMLGKGDFLQLLRLDQPFYLEPLLPASLPQPAPAAGAAAVATPAGGGLSQAEIRGKLRPMILAAASALTGLVTTDPAATKQAVCGALFSSGSQPPGLFDLLTLYGIPDSVTAAMQASSRWLGGVETYCFFGGADVALGTRVAYLNDKLPSLLDLVTPLDAGTYKLRGLTDIKELDLAAVGLDAPTVLTTQFYGLLQNSSTNYDRRRAAYILSRYFCDDLTPINVAAPAAHGSGRHASDPNCQSCHYKLDPMAGFFKDKGVIGISFAGAQSILFDDQATAALATYEQAWRAPAGSGRKWDIGYVRSAVDPTLNTYGETTSDLFHIVEKAPEARQCLVRRMFEYFVGEEQAIDPGYLEFLTERFNADAVTDSTEAFKNTVGRLVLGATFSEPDAVSNECYDWAPGARSGDSPPCRVNFILQRSCAACHSGAAAAAGLDLTHWGVQADASWSFPHVKDGAQVDRATTLQAMADRLNSTDKAERMPLGQDMPNADREQLVLWLQDALQPSGGK